MRCYILIIATIAWSQSYSQVFKFKAFETYQRNNGDMKSVSEADWIHTDFLVVANLDKDKINTYGQTKGDFDIMKYISNDTDEDGNTVWKLELLDGKAEKCTAEMTFFKNSPNFHVGTLTLYYPYEQIFFRLKKDE